MRTMWHATDYNNLVSIMENGIITGPDGIVYLCDTEMDAAKFLAVRGCKHILTLEIKIYKKDEAKIRETFDHSQRFFNCKAYGYAGNIPERNIKAYRHIQL